MRKTPGCHAQAVQPVADQVARGTQGLRIGVLDGYFSSNASPAAREAVRAAADALGVRARVEWPDAALGRAAAFIITAAESANLHLSDLRTRAADFEPLTVDRLMAGAVQPAHWVTSAQRFRRVYRDRVNALFADWTCCSRPLRRSRRLPSEPNGSTSREPVIRAGQRLVC